MTEHRMVLVELDGAELEGVLVGDSWYVGMRRVCAALGLDWSGQRQRIHRDPVLSKGVVIITGPSAGGEQEMLCLSLQFFHGWLFKVQTNRVKPDLRARLLLFQEQAYAVLYDAFLKTAAITPRGSTDALLHDLVQHVAQLTRDLEDTARQAYEDYYHLVGEHDRKRAELEAEICALKAQLSQEQQERVDWRQERVDWRQERTALSWSGERRGHPHEYFCTVRYKKGGSYE